MSVRENHDWTCLSVRREPDEFILALDNKTKQSYSTSYYLVYVDAEKIILLERTLMVRIEDLSKNVNIDN